MTLWWANKLKAKNALVRGQVLRIPPVSGLVVEVTPTDTLDSLARATRCRRTRSSPRTSSRTATSSSARCSSCRTPRAPRSSRPSRRRPGSSRPQRRRSSGGSARAAPRAHAEDLFGRPLRLADLEPPHQPVLPLRPLRARHRRLDRRSDLRRGLGHGDLRRVEEQRRRLPGLDLARQRAVHDVQPHVERVRRAWPACRAGQRVGRMGATGFATGSHLHFEVWKGAIWSGGTRVNPLAYL